MLKNYPKRIFKNLFDYKKKEIFIYILKMPYLIMKYGSIYHTLI